MFSAPAHAAWLRAESPNFIVYSELGDAKTREYIQKLEAFSYITDLFYNELGDISASQGAKTTFYAMQSVEDYRIIRPNIRSNGFNPYYVCDEGAQFFSVKDVDLNNDGDNGARMVPGLDLNLAYMFFSLNRTQMLQHFSYRLPPWLENGLGWYLMTAIIEDGRVVIGNPEPDIAFSYDFAFRQSDVSAKAYLSDFTDIIAEKPANIDKLTSRNFQNWLMTHYLLSDKTHRTALKAYLDRYAEGDQSPSDAFKSAGLSPGMFDQALKTYFKDGVPVLAYKLPAPDQATVTITNLPFYKDSLPLLNAALLSCPTEDYGQKLTQRIRKQAALTPGDDLSRLTLARAEILYGDPSAALPVLTERLSANPNDFEVHYWLGRVYLRQAQTANGNDRTQAYASARKELGRAYKLNQISAPALYYYAKGFEDQPDFPNDNTLDAVTLANDYANNQYKTYQIELLMRRGDRDEASRLVTESLSKSTDKDTISQLNGILSAITKPEPADAVISRIRLYKVWQDEQRNR
ncbi:tetratricopeptide repeat protein [Asticcacaulis endophyticus]|uniref:Tetratricopeptide repeat-containing protein n=1 Tax=Asticcacaulis endophyticus TaxID=1395890 RepID=A0A918QDX8_9CAUL|nr:hypothetical protein [Asticcacaulis endophyticus]GGZ42501.1 hypothetical protein GCM10011273_31650 [Asticcacaulis endophyticus]